MPFYHHVPKRPAHNLAYREALLELADDDDDLKQQIWIACARDELFFVNTMLYVFEPREPADLPFITWPFQDRTFMAMNQAMGKQDFGMEKSRDMGATWMFRRKMTFGLVARNEDAVDATDDPDCLMWKLDYLYEHLPGWMRPKHHRVRLSFKNNDNGSVISGYAATGDVARGGRKTAFGFDEAASWLPDAGYAAWASTQHVTNSRFMVSTPKGMAGIFADQMRRKDASMLKVSVHWSEHPDKQRGLYCSTDGRLQIIDTTYDFPTNYEFVRDGKLRSPWYDDECRRHPSPKLIAQELDIDYGGSGFPFFNVVMIDSHLRAFAMKPFIQGELTFSREDHHPTWREMEEGPLRLWCHLTVDREPTHETNYVIGCDIATGTDGDESTASIASVFRKDTGEKVAEMAYRDKYPADFADYVIALRHFFRGSAGVAFVAWESNGPGAQFGKHFMEKSPERVYYRTDESMRGAKPSKKAGWVSNRNTKRELLGEYARLMDREAVVNRSAAALEEMMHYVHLPSGAIEHDRTQVTLDPTSAGENHGDRVIADALGALLIGKSLAAAPKKEEDRADEEPPVGTMAWRLWDKNQVPDEAWL